MRKLDEADSLIAELLGIAQIGAVAYPEGSNRERAIKNWERRCIERDRCVGPEDDLAHLHRERDELRAEIERLRADKEREFYLNLECFNKKDAEIERLRQLLKTAIEADPRHDLAARNATLEAEIERLQAIIADDGKEKDRLYAGWKAQEAENERLQQKNETLQQLYADDCEKLQVQIEQLQAALRTLGQSATGMTPNELRRVVRKALPKARSGGSGYDGG